MNYEMNEMKLHPFFLSHQSFFMTSHPHNFQSYNNFAFERLDLPLCKTTATTMSTVAFNPTIFSPSPPAASAAFSASPSTSSSQSSESHHQFEFVFGSGFDFKFDFTVNTSSQVISVDAEMGDCDDNDCSVQTKDIVIDMDVDCDEPPRNKRTLTRKKRSYESAFDPVRAEIDNITFGFESMSLFCRQTEEDIEDLCIGIDAINFLGHSRMDVDKKETETQRRVQVVDDDEDEEMTDVADYQALKRSRRF